MSFHLRFGLFFVVIALWNAAPVMAGPIEVHYWDYDRQWYVTGSSRADVIKVTQKAGQLVFTAGAGSTVNGKRELKFPRGETKSIYLP